MGDGTKENPYTREDVLKLIEEHGGTAKGLDLSGVEFEEGIDLRDLDLEQTILFEAVFRCITLDELISQGEDVEFYYGESVGARLSRAHLEGARLYSARLERADLAGAHLEGAYLVGAHLEGAYLVGAHLEGANLAGAHLEGANLAGAHLEGACIGVAHITEAHLGDANWGNYVIGEEKKNDFYSAEKRYRHLKMWYTESGYYDIAGKFFYREKEANRKALKLCSKHWNDRLAAEFMRGLFGYGERWERIFIWMAVVVFGLATAYYFLGSFSSSSFWDTLYYSAASFTALGYGQWAPQPTGWAKGMGAAEAIIGVSMLALLLVTFVRKWTR